MKKDRFNTVLMGLVLLAGVAISPAKAIAKCNIKMIAKNYTNEAFKVTVSKAKNNKNQTLKIKQSFFNLSGTPVNYGFVSDTSLTSMIFNICAKDQCQNVLITINHHDGWSDIYPNQIKIGNNNYYLTLLQDCNYLTIGIESEGRTKYVFLAKL